MRSSTLCLSLFLWSACSPTPPSGGSEGEWSSLPAVTVPGGGGYGQGVSAPFIGLLDDEVIVAGGCNFPETQAAEGGAKRVYTDIYVLDTGLLVWRSVGKLPQPLAYGASASVPEGVICAGGTDSAGRPVRDVFLLTLNGTTPLPPLPQAIDNCAGTVLDGRFYVAGDRAFYIYDLASGVWSAGPELPGRRIQPVLVGQAGKVWLFGGYDPAGPEFVTPGGYMYDPATNEWSAVNGPEDAEGRPLLAAGGAAAAWGRDSIVCFGGVNAAVFTEALRRGRALAADPGNNSLRWAQRAYMEHEAAWYGFNDRVLVYHTTTGKWTVSATPEPQGARAGAAAVSLPGGGGVVLFDGELKPGVRTPEVWLWRP